MAENPPSSGRVGTFDGRFQYDHIFPRGRSGETLRAWRATTPDQLLVIKRPAPQDAPPMRAAQEVSIRTERKALERLSGHPVLVELRYAGTFRVGGQTHEYIAMDRAHGDIIADVVMDLAAQGERLPLLETLVIVDELLDLLVAAHDQQVVYNDVDAKHLFWDRENYRLKVIDWGNAVLLDEQGSNNITRQTDIYQVGELLYFIITGGKRFESETSIDGEHAVIFGIDAPTAPATLQQVITRATHPNLRRRYATIIELRQQLSEIRRPLQERRDAILREVSEQLSERNSQQQLEDLAVRLDEARQMDSGYPEVRTLQNEIDKQSQRLRTLADIDAGRIYLDNGNWSRATETMLGLLEQADEQTGPMIRFIVAAAELLEQRGINEAPVELNAAINQLEAGEPFQAALVLHNSPAFINQLLAERLTAVVPGVELLRPLLTRLEIDADSIGDSSATKATLRDLITSLNNAPAEVTFKYVWGVYQALSQQLARLSNAFAGYERALDVLSRANNISNRITNQLNAVAAHAYSEPEKANEFLQATYHLDPKQGLFDELGAYFEEIHLAMDAVANFTPHPDGSNLADWFKRVLSILTPYDQDLDDEALSTVITTLHSSAEVWDQTSDAFTSGQRGVVKANLIRLARQIAPLNPKISAWARNRADTVRTTTQLEQLGPNAELSVKLMDAYRLWDQGKFRDAGYQTEGAYSLASTDGEVQTVKRLSEISKIPAEWLEQNGPTNFEYTRRVEAHVMALFTAEEQTALDQFTAKMRSENDYLRGMENGLLEEIRQHSSVGVRILFMHYVLQGMMAVQERDLNSANFWRRAATTVLPDAPINPMFTAFDEQLSGATLIAEVETALQNATTVDDILSIRSLINGPHAEKWLPEVQVAIRQIDVAIRHWEDGEFKPAREALESALTRLEEGSNSTQQVDSDGLRTVIRRLRDTAADLQAARLKLEEVAHTTKVPAPGQRIPIDDTVEDTLNAIVAATEEQIGPTHAHQLQQWLSTYRSVKNTYTDAYLTKLEKLSDFKNHFANLFINRHPTFRLYQIWREVVQNLPENEPDPAMPAVGHVSSPITPTTDSEVADEPEPPRERRNRRTRARESQPEPMQSADSPGFIDEQDTGVDFAEEPTVSLPYGIIAAVIVVLLGVIGFVVVGGFGGNGSDDETPRPTSNNQSQNVGVVEPIATDVSTDIPVPTATETMNATDTPEIVASPTFTATEPPPTTTPLPTDTPTPTDIPPTATQTLPPPVPTQSGSSTTDSLTIDVLALLNRTDAGIYSWGQEAFIAGVGGPWQLGVIETNTQSGPVVVKIETTDTALLFGGDENAANRLNSIEIELVLAVPSPSDANGIGDGVYFGLGVENSDRERVSAEVRVPRPNAIAWGIRENDVYRERTGFTDENFTVTIRIERNADGTVSLYIRDQLLGESAANYPPGTPLIPVLYTSRSGVYVIVNALEFSFAAQ